MEFEKTKLAGLTVLTPEIKNDLRGSFFEIYRQDYFRDQGLPVGFVQVNQSHSIKNIIRGLHFQWQPALGKLMRVTAGSVFAVAADIRKQSSTFGKWLSLELTAENKKMIYAPSGLATGFCVISEAPADVEYFYTALYNPKGESNIAWNDADLGIVWPVIKPILSDRDHGAQSFKSWLARPESDNFK